MLGCIPHSLLMRLLPPLLLPRDLGVSRRNWRPMWRVLGPRVELGSASDRPGSAPHRPPSKRPRIGAGWFPRSALNPPWGGAHSGPGSTWDGCRLGPGSPPDRHRIAPESTPPRPRTALCTVAGCGGRAQRRLDTFELRLVPKVTEAHRETCLQFYRRRRAHFRRVDIVV